MRSIDVEEEDAMGTSGKGRVLWRAVNAACAVAVIAAILWAAFLWDGVAGSTETMREGSLRAPSEQAPPREPESGVELRGRPEPPSVAAPQDELEPQPPPQVIEGEKEASTCVRGRVVVAPKEDPAVGATVVLGNPLEPEVGLGSVATADEEGRFVFEDCDPQLTYSLTAIHPEYVCTHIARVTTGLELDLVLREGAEISGRVVDHAGQGIPGARLVCSAESNRRAWPFRDDLFRPGEQSPGTVTTCDSEGRFTVRGLTEGQNYELFAEKALHVRGGDGAPRVKAGAVDVAVRLLPVAQGVFSIADEESGAPVGRFTLMWGRNSGELQVAGAPIRLADDKVVLSWCPADLGNAVPTVEMDFSGEVMAFAYHPRAFSGTLRLGGRRTFEKKMKRKADAQFRSVRFQASFPDGSAYQGRLEGRTGTGGGLGANAFALDFSETGMSRPVRAKTGKNTYVWRGVGKEGVWWSGKAMRSAVEIEPGADELVVPIQLLGTRVGLTVLSPDGDVLRGFGLAVAPPGTGLAIRYDEDWDTGRGSLLTGGVTSTTLEQMEDSPAIWLPAGTWNVTANMPGVGRGTTTVTVSGTGDHVALTITLVRGSQWDLRAFAERHRK